MTDLEPYRNPGNDGEEENWSFPLPDTIPDEPAEEREETAGPLTPDELEEILGEAELYRGATEMESVLEQEGIPVDAHLRTYLREISDYPFLTEEEERELARRASEGDEEARERLIESELRLTVAVAKRYAGRGLPIGDLIQEGSMGLMSAAEKFDADKGYSFSTYAVWWIRRAVGTAVSDRSRVLRLPMHMVESIYRVRKSSDRLLVQLGREPSVDEIAADVGMTADLVEEVLRIAADPSVLETQDSPSEGGSADEDAQAGEEKTARVMDGLADLIRYSRLSPREEKVMRFRFGMDGERARTLDETAEEFGITRDRVRQIESRLFSRRSAASSADFTPEETENEEALPE